LLLFVCATVKAQLFPPFTSLRIITTEKFDIIFPEESEHSARLLATYADSVYENLSALFGIQVPGRIPVTFAPHTDIFNGYYNPVSSPRIVLFDTAMDLEWTTFEDNLKGLFIHELVHAITLNTRSPFYRVLHRIFGNWATPALWNAPAFMVEGAAIVMESLPLAGDGFGRANDPRIRQILRQAIHEGKFQTPFQASGVYDFPGQQFLFYEYGGLFSAWLLEQYGIAQYAELWQAMGRDSRFSFSVYRSGFYNIFRRVYGINFLDAWSAFRDSLSLNNIEEAPEEILTLRNSFSALAKRGTEVYILNRTLEKIHVYNTQTDTIRTFNTASALSYDLDISPDGTTLLVSGYQITGSQFQNQRGRAVVTEQRTDSGQRTGRTIHGLFNARYFRDGVIGITSELHNNNIVFKDFNGNTEILFRGNERLMFSRPQAVDNEKIVFIAARSGERELLLYNYVSGELFRIENYENDNEYQLRDIWRFMRGLSVSEGKLLFSHNTNDRMYKLALIDLETRQAVFNDRDFSGGVFNPVSVNGTVYYRASFFSGDGVLRFPETLSSLSGMQTNIRFTAADADDYGLTPKERFLPVFESRPYYAIRYMSPFDFWLPLPLIRQNENTGFSIDGAGLLTAITDPTDRHLIIAAVYADITNHMAVIDYFSWQNTVAGFPINLNFSDRVETNLDNDLYRATRLGLWASFSQVPRRWAYGFSLGLNYTRIAEDDGDISAYNWGTTNSSFYYFAGLSFSNIRRRQNELFGNGMSFGFRGANIFENNLQPRFEGLFWTAVEARFPLALALYGAYDQQGMNLHGASQTYGGSLFAGAASIEYNHPRNLNLTWIGGAELSLGLFSFEIQRNLSHLYFNRIFCTLSLRNVLYDSQGHPGAEGTAIGDLHLAQSLVLRLRLVSSVIPIKMVPLFIEPNIWGAWKFSNTITGQGDPWNFGIGINLRI